MDVMPSIDVRFKLTMFIVMTDFVVSRYHANDCRYQFNVWEPNENMVMRMNELQVKYSNFSNYVDKELANYKLMWYHDLRRSQNWTYRLENLLMDLKVSHIQGMTKVKDIETQVSEFLTKLDNIETTVDDMKLKRSAPRAIRKKHIRNDRTLSQSDSPEAVPFSFLKNMVGDLKSEWIVMKRELIQLENEYRDLRKADDLLRNESKQVQAETDKVTNELTVLKLSQKRYSNDVSVIKTDVDRLKMDLGGVNDIAKSLRNNIGRAEKNVVDLQTSTAMMKKDVLNLQAENEFLKKQLLSNPKGSLVLEHGHSSTRTGEKSSEDHTSFSSIPRGK